VVLQDRCWGRGRTFLFQRIEERAVDDARRANPKRGINRSYKPGRREDAGDSLERGKRT